MYSMGFPNAVVLLSTLFLWLSLNEVKSHGFIRKRQTICEDPFIDVEQGRLKGKCEYSVKGQIIYSFMGIPYATPPTNSLRFKDPQPPENYDGIYNAQEERNVCPQYNINFTDIYSQEYIGDEDCLYLNIYTPCLSCPEPLAVIVWFHPGIFKWGSGNRAIFGPDYLLAADVILITLNYRLGPLGFLYMEEAAPGNVGLKDQVQALRWIQGNIQNFGGDTDRITIYGGGAGAACAQLHQHSEMSKGLFSGVIAQSGNALSRWTQSRMPKEYSLRLAKAVGCNQNDKEEAVDCMRQVDVRTLIEKSKTDVLTAEDNKRVLVMENAFVPTVDYPVENVEPFLKEPIFDLVTEQRGRPYPTLAGISSMEIMILFTKYNFYDADFQKELDNSWEDVIIPELLIPIPQENTENALKSIRNFYLDGKQLTNDTVSGFLNLLNDLFFGAYDYSLTCVAEHPNRNTYAFEFSVDDELNFVKPKLPMQIPGASNGDMIGYVFAVDGLQVPDDSSAAEARNRVVRAITEFAKYREINGWVKYNREGRNTNVIGQENTVREVRKQRIKFWFDFYEAYAPDAKKCPED